MAVSLAIRVAIALAPTGTRVLKWSEGPGVDTTTRLGQSVLDRMHGSEDDEALSGALSDAVGSVASVTTFEAPFELRKLQCRWGRSGSAVAGGTDDAITTHHFLYAPAGTPSDTWAEAQFLAVEGAFDNFWSGIKLYFSDEVKIAQYRWYKAGPAISPPQLPVRVVDKNLPGTSGSSPMPPQVAVSVTEKTADRKSWGRFYLPGVGSGGGTVTTYGRIDGAFQAIIADAADVFYETCVAADVLPVVYSSAKPTRTTAGGTELPARGARALTVGEIQVDDLFDVIRSRRYQQPLLRLQRAIAGL